METLRVRVGMTAMSLGLTVTGAVASQVYNQRAWVKRAMERLESEGLVQVWQGVPATYLRWPDQSVHYRYVEPPWSDLKVDEHGQVCCTRSTKIDDRLFGRSPVLCVSWLKDQLRNGATLIVNSHQDLDDLQMHKVPYLVELGPTADPESWQPPVFPTYVWDTCHTPERYAGRLSFEDLLARAFSLAATGRIGLVHFQPARGSGEIVDFLASRDRALRTSSVRQLLRIRDAWPAGKPLTVIWEAAPQHAGKSVLSRWPLALLSPGYAADWHARGLVRLHEILTT